MTGMERWLPVVGYEGFYEVSDLGRVRSVDREVVHGDHVQSHAGRVLKSYVNRYGYPCVKLSRDGRGRIRPVHVLMAEAFLPRPEWATQVRHLDSDPGHCELTNIVWGTQGENEVDKVVLGTTNFPARERCIRDHPLVAPNVIEMPSQAGRRRKCRACDHGRSDVRGARRYGKPVPDLDERIAFHFARIMGDAA